MNAELKNITKLDVIGSKFYFEIGEMAIVDGAKIICKKCNYLGCENCYFYNETCRYCNSMICEDSQRKDNSYVYFEFVK